MEIDISRVPVVDGKCERAVLISDDQDEHGRSNSADIVVWVTRGDSIAAMQNEAREATIAFLERALEALRRS